VLRFTYIAWFAFVLENGVHGLGNNGNFSPRLAGEGVNNERRLKVVKFHGL